MKRFVGGHRLTLLRNGAEYFPSLIAAIDGAQHEVFLETYIFADDAAGHAVSGALMRTAQRGVPTHVLVDAWGSRDYLPDTLVEQLQDAGVHFAYYRPEIAPWHFRLHRLRRLHRKLCEIDGRLAFVGGINIIADENTPGQVPPRVDFAVAIEGPALAAIVETMKRLWSIVEIVTLKQASYPLFGERSRAPRAGTQDAKFLIRDNLRNRRSIEGAYLAAIRSAKREIIIANAYFLPGMRFRHALLAAAERGVRVVLILQGRVEYLLLHFATRALYGSFLHAGIEIHEHHYSFMHAKVAVIDERWATVGSSNIDPFSLLLSREANVFARDETFARELRQAIAEMQARGSRHVAPSDWAERGRLYKAVVWLAYGLVRVMTGLVGYGPQWQIPGKRRSTRQGKASGKIEQ
jgi:cardiolipin synthase